MLIELASAPELVFNGWPGADFLAKGIVFITGLGPTFTHLVSMLGTGIGPTIRPMGSARAGVDVQEVGRASCAGIKDGSWRERVAHVVLFGSGLILRPEVPVLFNGLGLILKSLGRTAWGRF